jgi:hypothetical protein
MMTDGATKRRRLDDDEVAAIRREHAAGETLKAIAARHGVTPQAVWLYVKGYRRRAVATDAATKEGRE